MVCLQIRNHRGCLIPLNSLIPANSKHMWGDILFYISIHPSTASSHVLSTLYINCGMFFSHHRPYVLEVAKIFQHGKSWLSFCSVGTDLDRGRSIRLLHYTTLLKCVYRSGEYCTTTYVGKKYCKVFCDSQGSCM